MKKSDLIKIIKEEIANVRYESYGHNHNGGDSLEELLGFGVVEKMIKKFKEDGGMPAMISDKGQAVLFQFNGQQYGIAAFARGMDIMYNLFVMDGGKVKFVKENQKSGSDLESLFVGLMLGNNKGTPVHNGPEAAKHYNQLMSMAKRVEKKQLKEGWFKNLAVGLGLATALSFGGGKSQAATGSKTPKIEFSTNIPKSRQVEVMEAFQEFLKRCEKENGSTPQSKKVKGLLDKKAYDQIVLEFMAASDENDLVSTTMAESEVLKKNFVAIAMSIK